MESINQTNSLSTAGKPQKRTCIEIETSGSDVSPSSFDRYFVVKSADENQPVAKLSPFIIEKALKCTIGTAKTIQALRSGDLLVQVSSAAQSRSISKLDKIADRPVTVTAHRTLNTCKGVIRCRELIDCDTQEILDELKPQGVVAINNISVRNDSGGRRNTNTFIVSFRLADVPKYIKIGYIRVPVSIYIPNPLRCFQCQKFGHGKRVCKGKPICAKCGQSDHNSDDCSNEPKCANCKSNHPAYSTQCPKWLLEKKVQKLKAERGISFVEARRIATAENNSQPTQPNRTAAAVVSSRCNSTCPATCSVSVQTDLTWPDGHDTPSQLPVSTTSHTESAQTETQTDIAGEVTKPQKTGPPGGTQLSLRPTPGMSHPSQSKAFNKPRPPTGTKKPKIRRPPKSDSEVKKHNRFHSLQVEMETDASSESENVVK